MNTTEQIRPLTGRLLAAKLGYRVLAAAAMALVETTLAAGPAQAIAVDTGNEAKTVLDPATPDGPHPGHGPWCGIAEDAVGVPCVHNGVSSSNPGLHPGGLAAGINLGAWNSVFQSNENSAICGIWATTEEAAAAGEGGSGLPTCEGPA